MYSFCCLHHWGFLWIMSLSLCGWQYSQETSRRADLYSFCYLHCWGFLLMMFLRLCRGQYSPETSRRADIYSFCWAKMMKTSYKMYIFQYLKPMKFKQFSGHADIRGEKRNSWHVRGGSDGSKLVDIFCRQLFTYRFFIFQNCTTIGTVSMEMYQW